MGSKRRIAKYIIPLMERKEWYVEPFVGGCNIIDKVKGKRIGADNNKYLILMWRALQDGWEPPFFVSEDKYMDIKENIDDYPPELVAYVGFNSFGGKWFGGYPRTQGRDHWYEYHRDIMEQVPKIQNVEFIYSHYANLDIPKNSTIYCDPPYNNTTKYKEDFNFIRFWDFARTKQSIYISGYTAPSDFKCIWSKEIVNSLNDNKITERLFRCVTR